MQITGHRRSQQAILEMMLINSSGTLDTTVVHHSNFGCSTSALGQKRTSHLLRAMSALPPKADIAENSSDVR
jgi:hypothetical protein